MASVMSWFALGIVLAVTARAEEEPEDTNLPEPVALSLDTKDGVSLSAMFYSNEENKQVIPVVLLHDHKGTRHIFDSLARQLQEGAFLKGTSDKEKPGIAVLAVDLRGHGESTRQTLMNGQTLELDASKFKRQDILNMIRFDMEAVRKFLVDKNDQGQLNLNKLCLVGVGMGATVAIRWTALDWKAPPLAMTKQGQDVKALVLISPQQVFMGIPIQDALRQPGVRDQVSVLIICGGQDRQAVQEANRIYKTLEPFHPEPPVDEREEKQDLFFQKLETTNQGGTLFEPPSLGIEELIAQFIELRLVAKEHEWLQRRRGR